MNKNGYRSIKEGEECANLYSQSKMEKYKERQKNKLKRNVTHDFREINKSNDYWYKINAQIEWFKGRNQWTEGKERKGQQLIIVTLKFGKI